MALTNDGAILITSALLGDAALPLLNNANAALGVGDGTAVFAATQIDLQGTNKLRKGMNTGFPSRNPDADGSDNMTRYQASFGTAEANYAWEEWGIFNDVAGGTMLVRVVENLGTKTSASKWMLEIDLVTTA